MEKTNIISKEVIVHKIYCDECNTYIGNSEEYDDGWYEELGKYRQDFYIPKHSWFYFQKTLCHHCREEMDKKIIDALIKLGFHTED